MGITFHTVTVPAGSRHLRLSLFDEETDGADDLDLFVFGPGGNFVGGSGGVTSAERVEISTPVAGDYTVVVHGFETDGPDANYTLFAWALGETAAGNLVAAGPDPATGPSGTVTLNWSGLTPGTRYLGAVSYHDGTSELGQTLVAVTA
ncbi:MAG: pre-peptidase C-terminal domain-containing protein [Micromonosporaceae bacterium]